MVPFEARTFPKFRFGTSNGSKVRGEEVGLLKHRVWRPKVVNFHPKFMKESFLVTPFISALFVDFINKEKMREFFCDTQECI